MMAMLAERPAHVPLSHVVAFDIYNPPDVEKDFHAAWRGALQKSGVPGIVWTPYNGGHWIATRYSTISTVMSDYERFSSRVIMVPKVSGEALRIIPSTFDPPEHRPFRLLLNTNLSPKVVSQLEDKIRSLAVALIEKVRARGECNFTTAYAEVLPVQMFLTLVDLPIEDGARLKEWTDLMWTKEATPESFARGYQNLVDYVRPWIGQRRGKDGQDIISRLVNGKVGDRGVTEEEAVHLVIQILLGGLDTVVNSLSFMLLYLARNPERRRELATDPTMIPRAIDELFRRFPISCLGREVVQDIEFEGITLKKGEMVMSPAVLGGIDDSMNENPMEVDFNRPSIRHLTFGDGQHKCPGMYLARAEVRITLQEWLARIPEFDMAPDARITCGGGIAGYVTGVPLVWDPARTRS